MSLQVAFPQVIGGVGVRDARTVGLIEDLGGEKNFVGIGRDNFTREAVIIEHRIDIDMLELTVPTLNRSQCLMIFAHLFIRTIIGY